MNPNHKTIIARESDDECFAEPVPYEWEPNEPTSLPDNIRVVLLFTEPSAYSDGLLGIFMGRCDGARLYFLDRVMEADIFRPRVLAWCELPPGPEWCTRSIKVAEG